MEHYWYIYSLSGLAVGFIVGMTGVGGGSLMTPLLVALGIPPMKAVGTDLLYAALTKAGGIYVHQQKKSIDWSIVRWLSLGSLPAAVLTIGLLHWLQFDDKTSGPIIKLALGIGLILTALAMLFKTQLQRLGSSHDKDSLHRNPKNLAWATCLTGVVLGVLVSLSSIGAGAIGTVALFFLYPHIPTIRIVGTDIAHAVPLTLIAGIGHLTLGTVNFALLGALLLGSLPGIYLGSHMSVRIPEQLLRPALATLLAWIGYTMIAAFWK